MEDAKDDFGAHIWAHTEALAAQGDSRALRELGEWLTDRHEAAREQAGLYERQLARVVRALALSPARDSLTQLFHLLDEKRPRGAGLLPRSIASLLAEHQQAADLVTTLFDRDGRGHLDELRYCLLHELLLRGVDAKALRPVVHESLRLPEWHPLARLPLHRSDLETHIELPSRSLNGSGCEVPTGLPAEGRMDPPTPRTTEPPVLRDVITLELHASIVAAVEAGGWGNRDAWVFALDEAITPDRVPALLPALPMSCVEGLGPTARFEVAARPVRDIWPLLFATASMGGMYSSGVEGAYGRLAAWKSLAGLCGAAPGASVPEVEAQALHCTWFHFEADADWFHNEIYDYGIAALSPDRRRIAVLAATDTD